MSPNTEATWPDLAEGLYERLTGRGTTISYGFDQMSVEVPNATGGDAARATWKLDGTLHIRTSEPGA